MRFGVLGPLEVTGPDGTPVDVGGAKPRALLTLLLADPGRVVGIDRIVSTLWGDDPPPTVTGTLQAYISHLRKVLEPERGPREAPSVLITQPPGYLLRVDAGGPGPAALRRTGGGRRPRGGRPATPRAASRCWTRRWRCGGASRWPNWATCRPSSHRPAAAGRAAGAGAGAAR